MQVSMKQAEKAMGGNLIFTQLGFSMLMWRLKRIYDKDATSDILKKCTDEINSFLRKHEGIMNADFAVLSNL